LERLRKLIFQAFEGRTWARRCLTRTSLRATRMEHK